MPTNFRYVWLVMLRANPGVAALPPRDLAALREFAFDFFAAGVAHHAATTRRLAALVDDEPARPRPNLLPAPTPPVFEEIFRPPPTETRGIPLASATR